MIEIRPMRYEDVDPVVDALWERGVRESVRFGVADRNELRDEMVAMLGTEYAWTMTVHDEPVVLMGMCEVQPGTLRTFFLATDAFLASGTAITRMLRRFITETMSGLKGKKLEVLSACDHPAAEKWFTRLGFIKKREVNGFRLFLYAPH